MLSLCSAGLATAAYYDPPAQAEAPRPEQVATVSGAANTPAPTTTAAAVRGVPLRNPAPAPFENLAQLVGNGVTPVPEASEWRNIRVRSGQTLSNIFSNLGLPVGDSSAIVALGGSAAQLHRLRTGDTLNVRINNNQLDELTYALDETHTLDIRRKSTGFQAYTLTSSVEHRQMQAIGTIEDSLFADGHRANLSDRLILQVADIFNYDIDFAQDLQPGDRFTVVYDVLYKNGKKLRDGNVLAAEFVNQGHSYRAVRYVDGDGNSAYYTPEGQSMRKAFIRTPVDFARISSGFTLHRLHPVLNTIRAHKGVDYAAPIGTPVKATADGRVEFVGKRGGYGNLIVLKHWGPYETAYGHLSRFRSGLTSGSKVHQGDVIGYVGMTGLATGPHLHYEFRIDGIHQNPVTVALPRGNPIYGKQLAQFKSGTAPLVARLDNAKTRFASAATSKNR